MKLIITVFSLFLSLCVFGQSKDVDYHLDKEYDISPSGTIKLNASDAKVYITGSVRKKAHVKIDYEVVTKGLTFGQREFAIDVSENNGNLDIREVSSSVSVGMIGYSSEKYTINIEAPEGASLNVRGDDGDYWITNINGAISLTLDDADVELKGCKGDSFSFRLDDGDLTMDQGKGSLDIDADDADVRISNAHFDKVAADVDDGDLVIESTLADNGDYRIDAQDGLVSFRVLGGGGQFNIRHDDAHVAVQGDFQRVEESENRSVLTLASGRANVDIRVDDGRVRLIRE